MHANFGNIFFFFCEIHIRKTRIKMKIVDKKEVNEKKIDRTTNLNKQKKTNRIDTSYS